MNLEEGADTLIATCEKREDLKSDETLSLSSRKGNDRRCIKLHYKKINRICAEMDLARSRRGGIKE